MTLHTSLTTTEMVLWETSRQTSLRHTCSHGLDGVGSAQALSQVRVASCNAYESWLNLDLLCVAAHHTCLGHAEEVGE